MKPSSSISVFAIFVEVQPEAGCDIDARECAGAFVRCYVPASDEMNATRTLYEDLNQRCFRLVNIEWCVDHDSTDWENPENGEQNSCVSSARATGAVVYGDFHTFGHDSPDA